MPQSIESTQGAESVAGVVHGVQIVELLPDVEVEAVGHVSAGVRRAASSVRNCSWFVAPLQSENFLYRVKGCVNTAPSMCARFEQPLREACENVRGELVKKWPYHVQHRKELLQPLLIVVHPGVHDRSVLLGNEIVQPELRVLEFQDQFKGNFEMSSVHGLICMIF